MTIPSISTGLQRKQGLAVSKGSQTAFLGKIAATAGMLFVHPILLLKVVAGDVVLSKVLSSPAGIKWLTEGFKPVLSDVANQALNTVSKVGLKQGMQSAITP